MARTIRKAGVKEVPLSELKDDLSRDLRRDLEPAWKFHLDLGIEVEHQHQRHVAIGPAGRCGTLFYLVAEGRAALRHGLGHLQPLRYRLQRPGITDEYPQTLLG